MKKGLLVIIIVIVVMAAAACNKHVVPGGPLDATVTPTANITVDVVVQDADSLNNTTPAQNVPVRLHYPGNSIEYTDGSTGNSGTARIMVHNYGTYQVELLPNTFNGYSNSVFDTVDVRAGYTEKTIIRYQPIGFTFATPTNTNWDSSGGTYTMTIKYSTLTPRTIALSVTTNATNDIQYWFSPVSSTTNNDDTVTFNVFVPIYYQITSKQLEFRITGSDSNNKIYFNYPFTLTQNWSFDITTSRMYYCFGNGGNGTISYMGADFENIVFASSNLSEAGEIKLDYTDLEFHSTWDNNWYPYYYWGGVNGSCEFSGSGGVPIDLPFVLTNLNSLGHMRFARNQIGGPPTDQCRIILRLSWGNFVFTKIFTSTFKSN